MYLFVATSLEPGPQHLEPGEEIEPLLVTWNEAMELIHDKRIVDAKTLVGLLHYDKYRAE